MVYWAKTDVTFQSMTMADTNKLKYQLVDGLTYNAMASIPPLRNSTVHLDLVHLDLVSGGKPTATQCPPWGPPNGLFL